MSAACFMLVYCLAYSSTLKMEVICSSETLVGFLWISCDNIPKDITVQHTTWQNSTLAEWNIMSGHNGRRIIGGDTYM
jgi:hypothetical protein